nr:probable F-box protein At3g61730 isoform X3 [Physcomitrium patens]|eukprot:XP_024377371.1 probable F-box protein At3g61730 isoform X3 [Physcomitrella patens]
MLIDSAVVRALKNWCAQGWQRPVYITALHQRYDECFLQFFVLILPSTTFAREAVAEQAVMGSAMRAFSQVDESSDCFSSQPARSPMLSCRRRRSVSPKKAKTEACFNSGTTCRFNEDIWISIMSFLDVKCLLRLALTNRHLCAMVKDDLIWKSVFLRDFGALPIDLRPAFSWMSLYLAACDGSHTFSHHETEKHIDWMRIGVFRLESGEAVATDKLREMRLVSQKSNTSESDSLLLKAFAISNVKRGIWIAGTMQTLDARHWELFLNKEYKDREWKYEQVCMRVVAGHCSEAAACIFDAKQLRSKGTHGLLNLSSWNAPPGQWQPKGITSSHGAAACTNLQPNQGLKVKFHTMKAGTEGPVVGIRICQQLA